MLWYEYLAYFFVILVSTLGVLVVCGLAVAFCEKLFLKFIGGGIGGKIVDITSIIGTPVHEIGHAVMCLIFGHKIKSMKLVQKRGDDGTLGYVEHSYNPKNKYQVFGNLFIGLGPIFSGLGVIILMMRLCYPQTLALYYENATHTASSKDFLAVFESAFSVMKGIFTEHSVAVFWRILAVLVILSISLHVNLSVADIKNSAKALPMYFIIVTLFAVITSVIGALMKNTLVYTLRDTLVGWAAFEAAIFILIIVFSVFLVLIALVYYLIKKLIGSFAR